MGWLPEARLRSCQDNQGEGSFPSVSLPRSRKWEAVGHGPRIGLDSHLNTIIQDTSLSAQTPGVLMPPPMLMIMREN